LQGVDKLRQSPHEVAKVIASIEEPELINRILAHRQQRGENAAPVVPLGARAPPQGLLLGRRFAQDHQGARSLLASPLRAKQRSGVQPSHEGPRPFCRRMATSNYTFL